MPAPVRNSDGSVTAVVNGVTVKLSQSELIAINAAQSAPPAKRPLGIVTGSGRHYGQSGTPRYGIWFDGRAWHYLDKDGVPIPGMSWKARNLNRAKFTFGT